MNTLIDALIAQIARELCVRHLMSDKRRAMELVRCVYTTGTDVYPKAVEYVKKRFATLQIESK